MLNLFDSFKNINLSYLLVEIERIVKEYELNLCDITAVYFNNKYVFFLSKALNFYKQILICVIFNVYASFFFFCLV